MFGSDILLYPDTGPEFLRSLKMAVLYSERVHVLTLLDKALLDAFIKSPRPEALEDARQAARLYRPDGKERTACLCVGAPRPLTDLSQEYLDFVNTQYADLSLLAREGVLISHFPKAYGFGGTFRADSSVLRTFVRWSPSYWHFTYGLPVPPAQRIASFQGHLCFIGMLAQHAGLGLSTWSWDLQQTMWDSFAQLKEGGPITMAAPELPPEDLSKRGLAEAQLAETVLEQYLPRVDDLPFDEILALRCRYHSELKAFQVGVGKLATEIQLEQDPTKLRGQIADIVSSKVNPAVHELNAALTEARRNILKNLTNTNAITRAAIGVGIALLTGSPIDIGAAIAAGAATVGPVVEGEVERRNRLGASQWSLLFHLNKFRMEKLRRAKHAPDSFSVGP